MSKIEFGGNWVELSCFERELESDKRTLTFSWFDMYSVSLPLTKQSSKGFFEGVSRAILFTAFVEFDLTGN